LVLLLILSGTEAVTKLLVLLGPSSPRLMTTASALSRTPSVVTPPPLLPESVAAPPELSSTNFETVPLTVTVPLQSSQAGQRRKSPARDV
jgi:hypothetical protein